MRATNLQFRSPAEKTAEFRESHVNKTGDHLQYNQEGMNKNGRQSTFSQEIRFKEAQFYCKYTGESVFLGPGSYNHHESFARQAAKPCSAMMRRPGMLDDEEAKKQCYVMVGDQIKFDPAWCSPAHKKVLEEAAVAHSSKSVTMGIKQKTAERARDHIKKLRKNQKSANMARKMDSPEKMIHQALFENAQTADQRYAKFIKSSQKNLGKVDIAQYLPVREQFNYMTGGASSMNNRTSSQHDFYGHQQQQFPEENTFDKFQSKHDQKSTYSKKSVRTTQASTKMQMMNDKHRRDDSLSIDNVFRGLNTQGQNETNNQSQNVLSNNDYEANFKTFKQPRSSYLTSHPQKPGQLMNNDSSTVIFDEQNNGSVNIQNHNYNQSEMGRLAQESRKGDRRNQAESSLSNDFSPGKRSHTAQSHTVRVSKGHANQFNNVNQSHRVVQLSEFQDIHGVPQTAHTNKKTITSQNTSLPKTAINFHKMKKGLYLNQNRKDLHEFVSKQQKILSAYNVRVEEPDAFERMYDRNNEAASMGEMNNSMYNVHDAEALTHEQTLNSRGRLLTDAPAVSMHGQRHDALSYKEGADARDTVQASSTKGGEAGAVSAISTTINTHFAQPTRILKNSGSSLKYMKPNSGLAAHNRYAATKSHQAALKKLRESRRNSTNYSSQNLAQSTSQAKQKAKIKRGFSFMNAFKTTGENDLTVSHSGSMAGAMREFKEYQANRRVGASVSAKAIDAGADPTMAMNGHGVYMNVIRESQQTAMKKEKLAAQKQKIMGMSFDGLKRGDITRLNNFISDCQRSGSMLS